MANAKITLHFRDGTSRTTTRDILEKAHEHSLLRRMFCPSFEHTSVRQTGPNSFYCETDGKLFHYILGCLEDGRLPDNLGVLQMLETEADFFKLVIVMDLIVKKKRLIKGERLFPH